MGRNISHNIVFQSHTCTMENILKYKRWECGTKNSKTFIFQFEFSLCFCTSSLKWKIIYYFKYYPLVFDCIFNFSNELKWKKSPLWIINKSVINSIHEKIVLVKVTDILKMYIYSAYLKNYCSNCYFVPLATFLMV